VAPNSRAGLTHGRVLADPRRARSAGDVLPGRPQMRSPRMPVAAGPQREPAPPFPGDPGRAGRALV